MSELTQCICGYEKWQDAAEELSQSHTQLVTERQQQSARIAAIEAELAAARNALARYVVFTDAERESGKQVLTRLVRLLDEWERADCTSSTLECAEQVRAILRGEGPQGWESREGGDNA